MSDSITPVQPEKEPKKVEDIFAFSEAEKPPVPETRERTVEVTREAVSPEAKPERPREAETEEEAARRRFRPLPPPTAPATPTVPKSSELVKIESVLSEHLDSLFLQMTPQQQIVFQQKGEETATKIEKLMREVKLKVREVLSLIKEWLKLIPGVNKFFLEQEAKIKTDRLLALHEQKYKQK